jgi:hypothetical protein
MKTLKRKYLTYLAITTGLVLTGISCSDSFFDNPPPGAYNEAALSNSKGVEGQLIATYSMLDGSYFQNWDNNYFVQNGGAANWVWGSIRGGEAYKGTEPSDGVDLNSIETHSVQPNNGTLPNKWVGSYDGISRANYTLQLLAKATDVTPTQAIRVEGEARFLRAHFHFEALKVFGVVPYVNTTVPSELKSIENDHMIWSELKADLQFAYDNLPGTMPNRGRANKYAAGALLAKVHMWQGNWAAAKTILDDVINNGTTAGGSALALEADYGDIFRVATENSSREALFGYEASAEDGTIGNGNYENTLNQPHGGTSLTACCGFFQPSQNFVNAFKTSAGLPMPTTYNNSDLANDEGLLSSDPYVPDITTPVDPRLDHSTGRRGIPYLDWGLHPGNNWIRLVSNGGPYSPKKNVPTAAELGTTAAAVVDWGFASTAQNVHIIRFGDILLMSAEVEAELNNLATATTRVNQIRTRAAASVGAGTLINGSVANYVISNYPNFATQAAALEAIRFERMLELGMEGHRMFDLVRWHYLSKAPSKTALAFDIVSYLNNTYLAEEKTKRNHLSAANFTEQFCFMPIPEGVVAQTTSGGVKMVDQSTAWGGARVFSLAD